MDKLIKYVIVTPVRDEENYLDKTIDSVISQSVTPTQWIIVNDGSSDRTGQIADAAAARYSWMTVVHRPNRGFRKAGGGVIEAFYEGYAWLREENWDFIVKLDGDLSFESTYFERCFEQFTVDAKLGVGGGTVCVLDNNRLNVEATGDPPFHVRGATKIYRRACWEQISPLISFPGWDTVDEVKANMMGWNTRTFSNIMLIQHKQTGSADGEWRNWFKNGLANYITGYHPLFMLAKGFKRAFQRPIFLCSIALWAGFCSGYLKGLSHLRDKDTMRYLRHQQARRLLMRPSIYG
jgi:poly-beta-1,6-N-acetyl-D-glucosamine synthase